MHNQQSETLRNTYESKPQKDVIVNISIISKTFLSPVARKSSNNLVNMIWTLLLAALILLYIYVYRKFQFFKKHGIPHEPGYFPLGSLISWKALTGQIAFFGAADQLYEKYSKHKAVGYYGLFGKPILVITDLDLAKKIMVKDFDHFVDRPFGEGINPEANKHFSKMLTVLKGDDWRSTRTLVTPIFTSGKIKATVPVLNRVASELVKHMDDKILGQSSTDSKELFQKYTVEVLARLGCGVEPNILANPDKNVFYEQVSKTLQKG